MSLLDIADVLLTIVGIGTALAVVATVPVVWDHYQREQMKKRRNP
jgi:hypothetical protein